MPYRKTVLPGGVRVISERMESVRSVTLGIWAEVGSAVERREQRGISHLVEHMLFKGTERRSAREIAETMDAVGGNLNAFTDKETTCYYAKVVDRHLPLALDVLADMFLRPTFDPEELRKEQNVVLDEIKMYEDSPDEHIHDLFIQTMWRGSDLGDPTIGFAETVTSLTSDDLRLHMRLHYAPNAVVVAAAGNVDHDAFVEMVARAFDGFDGRCELPEPEVPATRPQARFERRESEQAYVILGTRGLSVRDERRYVLSVMDTILGGGMSSRLFQELRERRGLVYTVYSFQTAYREAGLFGVYAATAPEKVQACIDVILEQMGSLREGRVSEAEVRLAKEHIKGNLILAQENTSNRMIRLGRNEFAFGRLIPDDEVERRIDAVSLDDIVALSRELLAETDLGLCVLGPVDGADIGWASSAA